MRTLASRGFALVLLVVLAAGCGATVPDASPSAAAVAASSTPSSPAGSSLAVVKSTSVPVDQPTVASAAGDTVWVLAGTDVARIDVASNAVTMLGIGTGDELDDLVATADTVWVADFDARQVLRIDPKTNKVVGRIDVGTAEGVRPAGNSVWVTNHHEGTVTRIDPATNHAGKPITVGIEGAGGPQRIGVGAGSVWVDEQNDNQVVRMDPATGKILDKVAMPTGFGDCGGILATDDAVWVSGCGDSPDLVRIDPATNDVVATISLDRYGEDPVEIGGRVWVPVGGIVGPGTLDRIDPATNTVDSRLSVDGLPDVGTSTVAGGDLWIPNRKDAVIRIPVTELGAP